MTRKLSLFILIFIVFQSCHVGRFFIYNFANADDYKKFPKNELKKSGQPFYFTEPAQNNDLHLPKTFKRKKKEYDFQQLLQTTGTLAFIAIRNDSILYQWYRKDYDASSILTSFSMSKVYVSALVGIAIDEGLIKSTAEPITHYLTDLDPIKFGKITIQDLLDMRSGIKYNESYINPFGDIAKYYYGTNLKKYTRHLKVESEAGKDFRYISLNTQLLGMIVAKASGKSLTAYLEEKLWQPLGMEFDASWSTDSKKHKTEKAFCCINARAKDFAKLGRLYLNKGKWNGRQIISENWVDESVTFKTYKNYYLYSNQWWHTKNYYSLSDSLRIRKPYKVLDGQSKGKPMKYIIQPSGDYFAQGLLGQFMYMSPKNNMIIIRLAKKDGWVDWPNLFKNIAEKN